MSSGLPRIVFVMGKGGVGRSTISTALAMYRARRREKVLIVEWALSEAIAPWFGLPAAGYDPTPVSPGLWVCNYRLDRALHDYFVNHLHLGFFYRRVVAGSQIQRLIDAAPGIAELLFIGQLFWLTTLAADEVGLDFDRLIVDAPATGHGASLLDLPATLRSIGATGLLGLEIDRVTRMMNDPAQVGVWVATTPEELAIEETLQLVPRIARDLQRTPLAIAVNRSVTHFGPANATGPWLEGMLRQLPIESQTTAETMRRSLQQRVIRESALRSDLQDATQFGMVSLDDQLTLQGEALPRAVIEAVSTDIEKWWENLA